MLRSCKEYALLEYPVEAELSHTHPFLAVTWPDVPDQNQSGSLTS